MMYRFCFNDCISELNGSQPALVQFLDDTLKEYVEIKSDYPIHVEGIITENEPSKLLLNKALSISLLNCIESLDRTMRTIAYRNFTKYPVSSSFFVKNEDDLLTGDYKIVINKINCEGLNAKIVSENEGVLFTLSVHSDLSKDELEIVNSKSEVFKVSNLYGLKVNTNYIKNRIKVEILNGLASYDKLLAILKDVVVSEKFEKGFKRAPERVQESILADFEKAISRNGATRLYSDGTLIKDVTPEKEKSIKVFELRIFDPVAYRVYFFEENERVYLAMTEQKPQEKVQTNHIKSAIAIIKELLATA